MEGKARDSWLSAPKWARPFIEEPVVVDETGSRQKLTRLWTILLLISLTILGFAASLFVYLTWHHATTLAGTILWGIALLILLIWRPRTGSFVLMTLFAAILTCQTATIIRLTDRYGLEVAWNIAPLVLSLVSFSITVSMPLRHPRLSRDGISKPYTSPTADLRSPEDDLTLWQWMTVSWAAPLLSVGNKRQMNDDDVWNLAYEFQHTHLHEAFRNLKGTVVRRLLKANWIDLVILAALACVELAGDYAVPIILQQLLRAMQWIDVDKKPAITWALLTLLVEFVAVQSGVFSLWFSRRCYERSRGEMITMLHEKVLHRKIIGGKSGDTSEKDENGTAVESRTDQEDANNDAGTDQERQGLISGKPKRSPSVLDRVRNTLGKAVSCLPSQRKSSVPDLKQPASMGKILNLMRNDVYETAQRFWECQDLLKTPIGLILSLVLVWRLIGWPSLIGTAVVVVAQIVNGVLARILLSWEKVRRKATDHKLQHITQYVEAIRHLRWYGWHVKKLEDVMTARQKELNLRIVTFLWSCTIRFINTLASGILPVAAFWAYTALAGQQLSVDVAFPALQLFSLLQTNLRDIPNLITILLNAAVAVGRIEDFMSEPDVAAEATSESTDRLELKNASFAWPGVDSNVLRELDLTFPPGLTVVVGPVASGKTALLQALLGELDLRDGKLVRPDAPVGYCAQTPWLESMTIKDNILFCSPYDDQRYRHVLEACALLPDLAFFDQGDLSPIGENGIGLSGGQKARVALARAVYSQAKFLLLDDPLSALDQQTAEWIVKKCLTGSLVEDRTVILVTHRTDLCHGISDQIVEMSEGRARVYKDTTEASAGALLAKINSASEQPTKIQESAAVREKFEDEEHRAHGGVQFKVYWEYIKAGQIRWWLFLVVSIIIWRLFEYGQTWFLKEWGEAYKTAKNSIWMLYQMLPVHEAGSSPISRLFDRFPDPATNPNPWLLGFMLLIVIQAVSYLVSQILMLIVTYKAGKNMFARIMVKISNANFRFYDVTPVGRLMNRLTGDVGTIDGPIADQFWGLAWEIIAWTTSLFIIASITPLFLVFSLGLTSVFVFVFLQFLPTSQSLRRLEMVSLSPLMSNFGALLHGLMTVRAFQAQTQFQDRVIRVTDDFQKMDHFYWTVQSWIRYRFDCLASLSTFLLTVLAVYSGLTPGLTAFLLIAAQRFVISTHRLCRQYGKLQLNFVSVERVIELLHVDQEDPGSFSAPASWPSVSSPHPAVEFQNVTVRYAPHLPAALKNVSFTIPAGSSTAVIGRTGSGKSTLALALLATVTPEPGSGGRILIDGVDIATVTKQTLRSRVTFLAQDPVLFPGTLRTNLDPLGEHSDAECAAVVARIRGDVRYGWSVATPVDVGGRNLSQGQRQLVGLARAILRRSALVVLDEATASVDLETSWEVQRVLKEELRGSTVVTIAHRAAAVRDCGVVVKLDKGKLVGFGTPAEVDVDIDQEGGGDGGGSGSGSGSGSSTMIE